MDTHEGKHLMIPVEDTDFIQNVANQTACDLITKIRKAAEYFREDPEGTSKCLVMNHAVIVYMITDLYQIIYDATQGSIQIDEYLTDLFGDAKDTINKTLKDQDERTRN